MRSLRAAIIAGLLMVILALSFTDATINAGSPQVLPPTAKVDGMTLGEWTARWWQWVASIPPDSNPIEDKTGANCNVRQSGPVFFLVGTFGGKAIRTCHVSSDWHLFFPILNTMFFWNPQGTSNEAQNRADAKAQMDNPIALEATVDEMTVKDIEAYRLPSPAFDITLPLPNIFRVPVAGTVPAVSDGYWLMLSPLEPGNHSVSFKGVARDGFTVEVIYNLIVGR